LDVLFARPRKDDISQKPDAMFGVLL
jgi:hypothetical protein